MRSFKELKKTITEANAYGAPFDMAEDCARVGPQDGDNALDGTDINLSSLSNAAIARKRETSLRATETLVQRTFASLGIKSDEDFNPRVLAVRMWQQGKVVVK